MRWWFKKKETEEQKAERLAGEWIQERVTVPDTLEYNQEQFEKEELIETNSFGAALVIESEGTQDPNWAYVLNKHFAGDHRKADLDRIRYSA
jgi:hypothetical protein